MKQTRLQPLSRYQKEGEGFDDEETHHHEHHDLPLEHYEETHTSEGVGVDSGGTPLEMPDVSLDDVFGNFDPVALEEVSQEEPQGPVWEIADAADEHVAFQGSNGTTGFNMPSEAEEHFVEESEASPEVTPDWRVSPLHSSHRESHLDPNLGSDNGVTPDENHDLQHPLQGWESISTTATAATDELLAAFATPPKKPTQHLVSQSPSTKPANAMQTVRVGLPQLGRLNFQVGELLIEQNKQSNQNEHLATAIASLRTYLEKYRQTLTRLRHEGDLAHQQGERAGMWQAAFDELLWFDDAIEAIEQIHRHSRQVLEKQQRLLTGVQDDLTQARMQPIGEIFVPPAPNAGAVGKNPG
ncbi:MAG: hypothetical protein HC925_08940 [Coleofasciculaceae cyanobacterium SM2_3_26]|nr:hypothetical protein [Coleofasciculaceae cyanobacterium SM2_3_26]